MASTSRPWNTPASEGQPQFILRRRHEIDHRRIDGPRSSGIDDGPTPRGTLDPLGIPTTRPLPARKFFDDIVDEQLLGAQRKSCRSLRERHRET
jgi:hypothetical protein